jgi:hypothetical protein
MNGITYQRVSKIGFHSTGSDQNGLRECYDRIKAAGRMIAVVDSHDDFSATYDANQVWPDEVLTIGDLNVFADSFDIEVLRLKAAQNPHVRYWQVYNEINGDWIGQTNRLIDIMQTYGDEFKFVIYNCGVGTPQYPLLDPLPYEQVARACHVARDGGHLLGLHEYGSIDDRNRVFRYRTLAAYLKARDALCPIVITEAGPDEGSYIGDDAFMEWVKAYDAGLMLDDCVIGCALWTLGGGGWQAVNYKSALPLLGEYIATVEPVTPPPSDDREFDYWLDADTDQVVSTDNPYLITMDRPRHLRAMTRPKVTRFTLALDTDGFGRVTGAGEYEAGSIASAEWLP